MAKKYVCIPRSFLVINVCNQKKDFMLTLCIGIHVKYPFSCQILMKLEYSRQIFKKYSKSNFTTIRSVGAELFRAERRTDGRTDRQT